SGHAAPPPAAHARLPVEGPAGILTVAPPLAVGASTAIPVEVHGAATEVVGVRDEPVAPRGVVGVVAHVLDQPGVPAALAHRHRVVVDVQVLELQRSV